jgi:urease accessory protein
MIRATRVIPAGEWPEPPADRVVLDHDRRHRRRLAMNGEGGTAFLLDLGAPMALRDGDALVLDDGRLVAVVAAAETLAEITAPTPADLIRVAWHLGNRHLPTQTFAERLRIRRDHVIEAMVTGLGAAVAAVEAPFDPEGGAYAGHHEHHHGHANPALDHDDRLEDEDGEP